MAMMGGFRNPAAPGLTRSLRINRQGPRGVTGSNTGDGEQAHDQKRVSPFWGGATIQGSREKYQQFNDDGSSAPPLQSLTALSC